MEVDMMILALICFVFLLLVLTILAFLWYLGLFLKIDIKTCKPPFADLEVAYKFEKGSYRDCGMLFTEVHSIAPELRCIGVYYDDPQQIESNSLRYIIGLILNDKKNEVKEELRKDILSKGFQIITFPEVEHVVYSTFPHRSTLSVLIAVNRVIPSLQTYIKVFSMVTSDFCTKWYQQGHVALNPQYQKENMAVQVFSMVTSDFCTKWYQQGHVALNPQYQKENMAVQEHKLQGYPLIEIYGGEEILYVAPLSKQNDFFVPEALAESEEEATSDQRNGEEGDDSLRELEEIPDTISSADSLVEIASKVEELPASEQILESLDDEHKGVSNGSEASTESFEELQLDS